MGGKDSKPAFLTYEDATKRVTNAELKRLKDAFKRYANLNSYISKNVFIKEVLGDGVPVRLAELLFTACSGGSTKGLGFKELVCGLVLLTRGRHEEKLKFLFSLYCGAGSGVIQKEELDALIVDTEGQVPQALSLLFRQSDQISYDYFRTWVLQNQEVTSLTRWLLKEPCAVTLSNNLETPTFYQTLAGVTHLEEPDIIELEKRYWQLKSQSKTGRFDMETFQGAVCPPVPSSLSHGLFAAFDENYDGHIDFKEMACGISACCRGPVTERFKFCFKVFDCDHDGLLSREELSAMTDALCLVHKDTSCINDQNGDSSKTIDVDELLEKHDRDRRGAITQEDFLVWAISHPLPNTFLSLLFQVCHIVLGLKPQDKLDEGLIVKGWLKREEQHGLVTGQTWYLVAMPWWQQWLAYVNCQNGVEENGDGPVNNGSPSGDGNGKKSHSRTGSLSLCPGLSWKSGTNLEDSLQLSDLRSPPHSGDSSTKYASLPRSSPSHSFHNTIENTSVNNSPRSPKRIEGVPPLEIAKPGPVDNSPLTTTSPHKVTTLTNEGGHLRRDKVLLRDRDFQLVPEPLWKALYAWYGGSPALPRNVIQVTPSSQPDLELYPLCVKLLKHQVAPVRPVQASTFSGMMGGIGGMVVNSTGLSSMGSTMTPRRYLAYTSVFSRKHTLRQVYEFLTNRLKINREELRLWKFSDETNMTLLEDETKTMSQLAIEDNNQLLIEIRNKDLTWPEEMSQIAKNKAAFDKNQQGPTELGATGLSNLGNTCFMNSALQCVSNTNILSHYFRQGMHLYELNRSNPLGMKGHIAQRYGELVKDLWNGNSKCIAPLKFRWTIGRYAPRFNGFQQHDSQELLAFLLDGLHEDLNRVHEKPYVELKDSDGRHDSIVAKEAWDNHLIRNKSIVVDLFHGQLKSTVRCCHCGNTSVRFDPFTFLSLPLPMDSCIHIEVLVMWLDGSVPSKYGLRLNIDEKYKQLKSQLSVLCSIPADQLLLVELLGASVKSLPDDSHKVRSSVGGGLYAYQMPPTSPQTNTNCDTPSITADGLPQIQREYKPSPTKTKPNHNSTPSKTSSPPDVNSTAHHNGGVVLRNPPSAKQCVSSGKDTLQVNGTSQLTNHNSTETMINTTETCDQKLTLTKSSHLVNGNCVNGQFHNGSPSPYVHWNGEDAKDRSLNSPDQPLSGFIIAVHRKMIRMDLYFLSSQKCRPSLFGVPLILPCDEGTKKQDLYQLVWTLVARLVSPLPPSDSTNHAQDCDDSLGYEYPFSLKAVGSDGMTCAWCPWYRFCRGCKLECNRETFDFGSGYIAIDWEPTALHLRYQSSLERIFEEHASVVESRRQQTEPISLDSCLEAFTKEEQLGEGELYYCSKCKQHREAVKKLEIWKLPPILIIHLKRFQFHNGRWIKSHKIVDFPVANFHPCSYVVTRLTTADCTEDTDSDGDITEAISEINENVKRSKRHLSTSSETDYTAVKYNLYAMACHMGILGGGHYIAYAKNPNKKWYCYNDSSCKETSAEQLDKNSAYILFYESQTLNCSRFMPNVQGKQADTADIEDESESDLRKMCVVQ